MKNVKVKILLLTLSLILVIGGTIGVTYSRYIHKVEKDGVLTTPNFYFESDLLTADNKAYEFSAGTKTVSFTLMNYLDAFHVSPQDMYVSYSVSEKGGSLLQKSDADIILTKNTQSSTTITVNGLEDGKTYEVIAVGMYKKDGTQPTFVDSLYATFTVKEEELTFYAHLDTSESAYVEFTIRTTGLGGTATVTFPAGLIPDPFDAILAGIDNYDDLNDCYLAGAIPNISMNKNESIKFRFYKEDTSDDYEFSDFVAKLDGVDAVEFIP